MDCAATLLPTAVVAPFPSAATRPPHPASVRTPIVSTSTTNHLSPWSSLLDQHAAADSSDGVWRRVRSRERGPVPDVHQQRQSGVQAPVELMASVVWTFMTERHHANNLTLGVHFFTVMASASTNYLELSSRDNWGGQL
ncbi:uncharacterized protein [Triticum aestivum]|uniref:uncharacterized protein isoform X2 n=1 Tax=Triticum aestivum TaxID=4565 RepID=UPI001D02866D|nr:uncharacterized protein LOC123120673 isoform X2 [Triticum aestivum]